MRTQAVAVALSNNLRAGEVTPADVEIIDNNTKVRVTARRNRSLFFAGAIGIPRGLVNASATASITARYTPKTLPIGITTQTFEAFSRDTSVRRLTLNRLDREAFIQSVIPQYDPFALTDFLSSNGNAASPDEMDRQIGAAPGDLSARVPIKVGDMPSNLRASDNIVSAKFEDGIGNIFARAAAAPWNDPPTGVASQPWMTVGTRFNDVQDFSIAPNNPRVVSLFVTDSAPIQSGKYNYPVHAFAPVYIESVTQNSGVLQMQVRFLDPGSAYGSQPVSLVN